MNRTSWRTTAAVGVFAAATGLAVCGVPPAVGAAYDVTGSAVTASATAAAAVSVDRPDGATVQPGTKVRVRGSGFRPGDPVRLRIAGRWVATLTPGPEGHLKQWVTVPASVQPGSRFVRARQYSPLVEATARVPVHTDWPMARGNPGGTGASWRENLFSTDSATSLSVRWSNDTQVHGTVVVNGVVYAGWGYYDSHSGLDVGGVVAYDADTGKQLWRNSDGAVYTTPLVVGDRVFAQNYYGTLFVLDAANGEFLDSVSPGIGEAYAGGPVLAAGLVVVAGYEGVAAVAAKDEQPRTVWRHAGGYSDGIAVAGGRVFLSGGALTALGLATGKVLWETPIPGERQFGVGPVVATGGRVYATWNGSAVGAYDQATGKALWLRTVEDGMGGGTLAAAGDLVYTTQVKAFDDDERLRALDAATGRTRWFGPRVSGAMISIANGVLVTNTPPDVGTFGHLITVDAITGQTLATYPQALLIGDIDASPAIADGRIYYGAYQGFTALE